MVPKRRLARVVLAAVAAIAGCADRAAAQRYAFRNYGQEDGLTNPTLRALAQDGAGYLWAGTRRGLFRFDGERFQEFAGFHGFPGLIVQSVARASNGAVWVASRRGLARVLADRFEPAELPADVVNMADSNLAVAPDGIIYLGTNRGVFAVKHPEQVPLRAEFLPAFPHKPIDAFYAAPDGGFWLVVDRHLLNVPPNGSGFAARDVGAPLDAWSSILTDFEGTVWVRSSKQLLALPRGAHRFIDESAALPASTSMPSLALDMSGRLYAPTDGGIAVRNYETGDWDMVSRKQGLRSDAITCMVQDREGSIWLGMNGGGLTRWLGSGHWAFWTKDDGLANEMIWSIEQAPGRSVWVGSDGGLTLLEKEKARTWTRHEGLPGDHVRSLKYGPDGRLWIATAPGGLTVMDKNRRFRSIGKAQGLDTPAVYSLRFIGSTLWLCTASGLYHADVSAHPLVFVRESFPHDDPYEMFLQVDVDQRGRLWVAGHNGIAVRDDAGWHRLSIPGYKEAYALKIVGDQIWAGFADHGLLRVTETRAGFRFEPFEPGKAVSSMSIYLIGTDAAGRIWAAGDAGIDIFDGRDWINVSMEDGLVWNDMDAGAFLLDDSGSVWIGTSQGLCRYTPPKVPLPRYSPPITLDILDARGRVVDASALGRKPWDSRSIGFHFNALTFRNEKRLRFEFRLQPVESAWTLTDQHSMRIPTLSPGSYTFEVRARVGNYATEVRRASFTVPPPWWRTWPAIVAAAAALALGIRAFVRARLRRLLERQTELENAVRTRTHELEREKTELLHARERLAERAMRDGLTGLWNRVAIFEILARELHRATRTMSPVAVILADLDHFKNVNDFYGHLAGDAVLIEAARRIGGCMRVYDSAGRYGGEELLLILSDCTEDDAIARGEELRDLICAEPFKTSKADLPVTCSFGLVVSHGGATPDEMIELADQALYRAKDLGRNRVVSARDLPRRDSSRASLNAGNVALEL